MPPDGDEVEQLAGGEDQPVPPHRPGQHHEGQQPQHVLRRIDLVGQQEGRHDQEHHRPQPRPPRRDHDQRRDGQATQPEQAHREQIDVVELPAGQREDVPDRPEIAAPPGVVAPEAEPAVRGQDHHRQVHQRPADHEAHEHRPERPEPARPQTEQQQRAEQEERIELGRHPETPEHARPTGLPTRPAEHADGRQGDGQQIPVDQRRRRDAGGRGDHHRVPRPVRDGPELSPDRDQQAGAEQHRVDVDEDQRGVDPLLITQSRAGRGTEGDGDQPLQLEEGTGQHRILQHRIVAGVQVRGVALQQPAGPVQDADVGVAEVLVQVGDLSRDRLSGTATGTARRPGRPQSRSAGRSAVDSTSSSRRPHAGRRVRRGVD